MITNKYQIAQNYGVNKRQADFFMDKAVKAVSKMFGINVKDVPSILQHEDYLTDVYIDLLKQNMRESTVRSRSKNMSILEQFIDGEIDVDEFAEKFVGLTENINEYETSADTRAKTDNTSGKIKKSVNDEEAENKDSKKVRENFADWMEVTDDGWEMFPNALKMVSQVSEALEWDIYGAMVFCINLLEDVNAHSEAREVENLFNKMS